MGKIKDLTGQKFGRLTVIKLDSNRSSNGQIKWICQCECGNQKSIIGNNLTHGLTLSCGCLHKEKTSKNLIGQRFGKLIVIEKTNKRNSNRNIIWKCQCDCGNVCEVATNGLIQGYTNSCGCIKRSLGEYKIEQILLKHNIIFEKEKSFETCKSDKNWCLRFDFFINSKYLIEFDGKQHSKILNQGWFNEEYFNTLQNHDLIKNEWCKKNNIPLIRIPYYKIKTLCLEDLLLETSQFII